MMPEMSICSIRIRNTCIYPGSFFFLLANYYPFCFLSDPLGSRMEVLNKFHDCVL